MPEGTEETRPKPEWLQTNHLKTTTGTPLRKMGQGKIPAGANIGKILDKHFENIGKTLVNYCANVRQKLGQILCKCRPNIGHIFGTNWTTLYGLFEKGGPNNRHYCLS